MPLVSHRRRTGLTILVLASAAALAVPGCGPSKGSVNGVVNVNGKPLPSGTIYFLSQTSQQVISANIDDGKFSIPAIATGPAKVSVTTTPPLNHPGNAPSGAPAPPPVAPGKYVPIPKQYGNPDTSNLSYDVKTGPQTKDFDLTSP